MTTSTPWTQARSGIAVELLDPNPKTILLSDIAAGLSQSRYVRHTKKMYTVAEHCVWGSRVARLMGKGPEEQFAVLFHDAHEAYWGDMPSPVKRALASIMPGFRDTWKTLMEKMDESIWAALSPYEWEVYKREPVQDLVRTIDMQLLHWEKCHIMRPSERSWELPPDNKWVEWPFRPEHWDPDLSEKIFISEALALGARMRL